MANLLRKMVGATGIELTNKLLNYYRYFRDTEIVTVVFYHIQLD